MTSIAGAPQISNATHRLLIKGLISLTKQPITIIMYMVLDTQTKAIELDARCAPRTTRGHRNIAYRLLPVTRTRATQLDRLAGACRFVWNHFLTERLATYQFDRCFEATYGIKPQASSTSFYTLGKEFT